VLDARILIASGGAPHAVSAGTPAKIDLDGMAGASTISSVHSRRRRFAVIGDKRMAVYVAARDEALHRQALLDPD